MEPEEDRPASRPPEPAADRDQSPGWRRGPAALAAQIETVLAHRLSGWLMLGLVAWAYTAAYLHHPLFPTGSPAELRTGWWTWSDQFLYWKAATEMAEFRLTAAGYFYAPGYPALGALFLKLLPAHPFFVPNLLLVLAAAAAGWWFARRWLGRLQTLLVGAAFVVLHRDVLTLALVVPWNTIATQLTLLAGLGVMISTRGPRTVWWLTALAGLTHLVRPGDAACFAPMLVWAVLRLPSWRAKLTCAAGGIAVLGAVLLVVGLMNRMVFGTWSTPYESMTWQGIGFFAYPVLGKLFWVFVDGRPFFGEADPALLFRHPWLLLAVPGVVYAVRTEGMAAVAALATLALNWGLYLNYNDFFPSGLYRFSLIHYLVWGLAPLFVLSAAALLRGWRQRAVRWGLAGSAALAILALGIQLEPRTLPATVAPGRVDRLPATRPLWIEFPGVPLDLAERLQLDGRPMAENRDYQIPYVPADLRLLLSSRARGSTVAAPAAAGLTATPVVGDYVWRWRLDPARWRSLWR